MEVNSTILKLIIKECCRSLSYEDEERRFFFLLRPSLFSVWEDKKETIWKYHPDFTLNDFNLVLSNIKYPTDTQNMITFTSLRDEEIVNGEVLNIKTLESEYPSLLIIKMKRGQYLNVLTGAGLSLGDKSKFCVGKNVVTSEGTNLGKCGAITILLPTLYNIVLSSVFLNGYYRNNIGSSLWPIHDEAIGYILSRDANRLGNILRISTELGIGTFALFHILNGVCAATK